MNMAMEKAKEIITSYSGKKIRIMEVCGTHTHEIFKLGIRKILPENIELISGPGCPVCVTETDYIDEAVYLALEKNVTICTFGDLIKVPGSSKSLADARSLGAKIKIVYTPLDALDYARKNLEEEVVFLSVGFETTTPSVCLALMHGIKDKINNFSLLVANKTMPNAYRLLKDSADAFLYPGHVNAITGEEECRRLCEEEGVSGVIAGFTPEELLDALACIVTESQKGKPFFKNCYQSVVRPDGNKKAVEIINTYMQPCDSSWRGIGIIPMSGLKLKEEYSSYDARIKYNIPKMDGTKNPACRCGEVLKGECKPTDCKVFGTGCTPYHPVGACMVSGEGACSAYYMYGMEG